MAVPLPISNAKYSALYDGILRIEVSGDIPGAVVVYQLQRDTWLGGLKFSLVGYYGGVGKPPPKAITTDITEAISLPMPHFNNKTVLVETADGVESVEIKYTGLIPPPPKLESAEAGQIDAPVVLPPIKRYLPGGQPGSHTSEITALLPPETWDVRIKFDPRYLSIWHVVASHKTIRWFVTWQKEPENPDRPVSFNVITAPEVYLKNADNGKGGKDIRLIGTNQPYEIFLVLLANEKS